MPKTPIDYSKTLIYKIVSKDIENKFIYVGSTTDFTRRKAEHKKHCNNPNGRNYNLKVYKSICENGGWDEFEMVKIEDYNAKDGLDARSRERYWFETLQANLNTLYPNRTQQEWRRDNKEQMQQLQKKHYEKNKEQILQQQKKHYEKNKEEILEKNKQQITCECGSVYRKCEMQRHKRTKKHQDFINPNLVKLDDC